MKGSGKQVKKTKQATTSNLYDKYRPQKAFEYHLQKTINLVKGSSVPNTARDKQTKSKNIADKWTNLKKDDGTVSKKSMLVDRIVRKGGVKHKNNRGD